MSALAGFAASIVVLLSFLSLGAGDAAVSCGAGRWYDDAAATPVCYDCANPKWCPGHRSQDSECREGHTVTSQPGVIKNIYFCVELRARIFHRPPCPRKPAQLPLPPRHPCPPRLPTPGLRVLKMQPRILLRYGYALHRVPNCVDISVHLVRYGFVHCCRDSSYVPGGR
jgi:hypothetical protein